ncbi:MAG: hypothetical protein ACE5GY_00525 [Thermodesulfobacteriota bacterium]
MPLPVPRRALAALSIAVLLFTCSILSEPRAASGAAASYGARSLASWTVSGAQARLEDGALVLAGAHPRLVSDGGLDVRPSASMARLRIDTVAGQATLWVAASLRGGRSRTFSKKFSTEAGPGEYRVYTGDVVPQGFRVSTVAVEFPGPARVSSISFDEPSSFEVLGAWWAGFWAPEPIGGFTINSVAGPRLGPVSFLPLLYDITIVLAAVIMVSLMALGRRLTAGAATSAVLVSMLAASFLFTLRMDYNWLRVWAADVSRTATTDERIRSLYSSYIRDAGGFIDFTGFVKESVPAGASVRPLEAPEEALATVGRYFMLPVLTSRDAPYVWTYNDPEVVYDAGQRALEKRGKVVAAPVLPYARFGDRGALYRVAGGAR